MAFPDKRANFQEELSSVREFLKSQKIDAFVDFEGRKDVEFFSARLEGHDLSVLNRLIELAKPIIKNEMGEWAHQEGSSGTLRFCADGDLWLDADSTVDDWSYERSPDEDDLENLDWEMDEETPEPGSI